MNQISAIGFVVPFNQEYYKNIQDLLSNENYQSIIYSEIDEDRGYEQYRTNINRLLFIYDSRTLIREKFSMPGPYEIRIGDNYTYTIEQKNYEKFFTNNIIEMKSVFNTDFKICYWNILTTFGVGTLDNKENKYFKQFNDMNDYLNYFGYIQYE